MSRALPAITQQSALDRLTRSQSVPAAQPPVALQAMLMPSSGVANQFPAGSRYASTGTTTLPVAADPSDPTATRTIVYLRRRFVPQPASLATASTHTVIEGERPDQIAAAYYNDPLQFWQVCDANGVLRPAELSETPGRQVRIPLPPGVPSPTGGA